MPGPPPARPPCPRRRATRCAASVRSTESTAATSPARCARQPRQRAVRRHGSSTQLPSFRERPALVSQECSCCPPTECSCGDAEKNTSSTSPRLRVSKGVFSPLSGELQLHLVQPPVDPIRNRKQ